MLYKAIAVLSLSGVWAMVIVPNANAQAGTTQATTEVQAVTAESVGQSIADVLRTAAGTEIAFITANYVREQRDLSNLASAVQYPTDRVVSLKLTGEQLRQAMERSLYFYPSANPVQLFVSGIEIGFKPAEAVNKRVDSIVIGGLPFDPKKSYSVAMPAGLAGGALGYFKIWDKVMIEKTLEGTLESLLLGKAHTPSASRWSPRG